MSYGEGAVPPTVALRGEMEGREESAAMNRSLFDKAIPLLAFQSLFPVLLASFLGVLECLCGLLFLVDCVLAFD